MIKNKVRALFNLEQVNYDERLYYLMSGKAAFPGAFDVPRGTMDKTERMPGIREARTMQIDQVRIIVQKSHFSSS